MNPLTAMIFPETIPASEILAPLLPVFPTVVYCQPLENDEQGRNPAFSARDGLAPALPCQIHVPAPLGADLGRFQHLLTDLHTRKDDYATQLGQLSLAGLGGRGRPPAESKNTILRDLLRRQGLAERAGEKRALSLWQARLVLKLGELFDAQQEKLTQELRRLSTMQSELLAELRQEPDLPFPLTATLDALPRKNQGSPEVRLTAWARLWALGECVLSEPDVYVTTNRDALEKLQEAQERLTGKPVVELVELPLPSRAPELGQMAEQRAGFYREAAGLLHVLGEMIRHMPRGEGAGTETFASQQQTWATLLEKFYPSATHGRCQLQLFRFPAIEAKHLFIEAFGRDEDRLPSEGGAPAGQPGTVIGLLKP